MRAAKGSCPMEQPLDRFDQARQKRGQGRRADPTRVPAAPRAGYGPPGRLRLSESQTALFVGPSE